MRRRISHSHGRWRYQSAPRIAEMTRKEALTTSRKSSPLTCKCLRLIFSDVSITSELSGAALAASGGGPLGPERT